MRFSQGGILARINIENSVYTDPRFGELVALYQGNMDLAIGALVRAWTLAQKYYLNTETSRKVPLSEWEKHKIRPELVQVGLAVVEGDLVYVRGSEEQFGWLIQRQNAGKTGGRPKKKVPLSPASRSKHLKPSFSSSSSSSVIPFPSETGAECIPAVLDGVHDPDLVVDLVVPEKFHPVASWMRIYATKYKIRYPLQRKDVGMLKNMLKSHTPQAIELMMAAYLAIEKPLYSDNKHPLSLFFRDLPSISAAAQTGVSPHESQEEKFKREFLSEFLKGKSHD